MNETTSALVIDQVSLTFEAFISRQRSSSKLQKNSADSSANKRKAGGSHIRLSILLCQPNGRNDPGPARLSADRIDHSGSRGPTAEGDRFTSGERIRRPGNGGLLQGLRGFDSVKHMPLMEKMNLLELPDCIYNWMVRYFESRGHSTRLGDIISIVAAIFSSIIQCSVVGPTSYVIVASDLHPKNRKNLLSKYADDIYLHFGSSMIHTATEEFDNIQSWAAKK